MPLKSDIVIDAAKFQPTTILEQTTKLNQHLIDIFAPAPKWYEVGAAKYRKMRMNGETPHPATRYLDSALDIELSSRENGRSIPCRLIYPTARKSAEERKSCKGSVLHFHGGGWVLGDQKSADFLLQQYADTADLAVLSVGYRLAPEHPYPAGPDDCIDVAAHLVQNSKKDYGGPLRFIGGESAGAHLSLLVTFHLLKTAPSFHVFGLLLHFGIYDLSLMPSARSYTKSLILNRLNITKFIDAFLPSLATSGGIDSPAAKTASLSPYYEDLEQFRGILPSALFTCGTDDPLLDDSVCMGTKWMMAGGEACVKIYPGAAHGFIAIPKEVLEEAGRAVEDTKMFIGDCMTNKE